MTSKGIVILIVVFAAIIAYGFIFPSEVIPDVKFYDTSINRHEIPVGGSAIISVNAISNEDVARNLQVIITVIGANADTHLTYPKITPLDDIETEGGVSDLNNKHITITAIDRSGDVTSFKIQIELQVDEITTDTITYDFNIVK